MLKRGLSVFLAAALMLLCFFCVPAFAAEPEFDISEYTIDDLKKMSAREKLDLLHQFEKEYGLDNHATSRAPDYIVSPCWTSGNPKDKNYTLSDMETHELMTLDAIALLCDTGYFITKDALEAIIFTLHISSSSALPDREISGIGIVYAGHFYNPETEKSFLPFSSTARSNMVKNYNSACKEFKAFREQDSDAESFADALEYIGKMLHFVQDACEPHHSSNEIASPIKKTPHSEFESYVFNHYEEFSENYNWDSAEYTQCLREANNDMGMIVHRAAKHSHVYINSVNDLSNQIEWSNTGGICTRKAILMSAIAMRMAFENAGVLLAL